MKEQTFITVGCYSIVHVHVHVHVPVPVPVPVLCAFYMFSFSHWAALWSHRHTAAELWIRRVRREGVPQRGRQCNGVLKLKIHYTRHIEIFARLKSNVWRCLNLYSIGVPSTPLTQNKEHWLRIMSFYQHFGKHLKIVWRAIFVIYKK